MEEMILLFFFFFCFLSLIGIFNSSLFFHRRATRRIKYYLNMDSKTPPSVKKNNSLKIDKDFLKKVNELIGEKLPKFNEEKVGNMLKSAGVELSPEEYVMLKCFMSAILGGCLYFLLGKLIFSILGIIIGYQSPNIWVKSKIKKRIQQFNEGLSDMIITVVGSLRSGYSLAQAFKTVVEDCESPIREEISFLLKEMNYGTTMEQALNNLNNRMPSDDLELMIQAVLIQRQVGGNLAEVLDIIVKTIRERNRIQRQIHTLTSQGRLSGKVIGALPFVLGCTIFFINPEYIYTLFNNSLGMILISGGIISGVIGFILINKLTKIEV